jgi:hypothetical protein
MTEEYLFVGGLVGEWKPTSQCTPEELVEAAARDKYYRQYQKWHRENIQIMSSNGNQTPMQQALSKIEPRRRRLRKRAQNMTQQLREEREAALRAEKLRQEREAASHGGEPKIQESD